MAASLAEPVVLAAAKDALYPEVDNQPDRYAVTDTQFSVSNWGGWEVPPAVHERLRPFNAIRLNSGAPDLLAVGRPGIEVLNGSAASSIVVAVEAKGHNTSPDQADVSLGIEQAYARLPEVNLGLVAAPTASVDDTARSLARELNIGVLGVDEDHRVSLLEPARVTGAGEFSTGLEAVRFQVRTHRLTEGSFPVNHPKNFLGYAIAVAADAETEAIYARQVIREVSGGRRGAILLGLVEPSGGDDQLTALGAEVVRFAIRRHGSLESALDAFDEWTGRSTRFTELAPRWAQLARSVTTQ